MSNNQNKQNVDSKVSQQKKTSTSDTSVFDIIDKILDVGKSIFTGITRLFGKLTGSYKRSLDYFTEISKQVMNLRSKMIALSDDELKAYTTIFKERLKNNETLDDIMIEAFAVVREAARRVLREELYQVQIIGGLALHHGMIAEMRTGEGKTLVAVAPAYLNALTGKGVHIISVNDYLVKRDSQINGKVFEFLGLNVGCVTGDIGCDMSAKKKEYAADITYCVNSEVGFDYLRDNMVHSQQSLVQRGFHFCIVDEVDSVLIDEARTPLIMSSAQDHKIAEETRKTYQAANDIVSQLYCEDYDINLKEHDVILTDSGVVKVERIARDSGFIGDDKTIFMPKYSKALHRIAQCLKAHHLYKKDKDYVVQKERGSFGETEWSVKIVDEYTGRILEGRRYSDGLHQALEAKEGVTIKSETSVVASVTFRCLFQLYEKISGMTGTAMTEEEEFEKIYGLHCIKIPTNKPMQRKDYPDILCGNEKQKVGEIIKLIRECHDKGQPVLLGTINVDSADYYYRNLIGAGFSPRYVNVLSAKHHAKEAEIIANAGRWKSITVVTNMAGRGTDIKLGGDLAMTLKTLGITDPYKKEEVEEEIAKNKKAVVEAGGLYVIGAEHNLNRRVDDQLRGRSGRQGDPGASVFFVGPKDTILQEYNQDFATRLEELCSDEPFQSEMTNISKIQQSVEAMHFESRHSLQKYADIKEFYMLQFYVKRKNILTKPVIDDLSEDFQNLLNAPDGVKWFKIKNQEHTYDSLVKKFNEQMLLIREGARAEQYIRSIILKLLDKSWSEYLENMSHARDIVSFQSYAQKDPVMIYTEIAEEKFRFQMKEAFYSIFDSIISGSDDEDYSDPQNLQKMFEDMNLANFDHEIDADYDTSSFVDILKRKFNRIDGSSSSNNPEKSMESLLESLSEKLTQFGKEYGDLLQNNDFENFIEDTEDELSTSEDVSFSNLIKSKLNSLDKALNDAEIKNNKGIKNNDISLQDDSENLIEDIEDELSNSEDVSFSNLIKSKLNSFDKELNNVVGKDDANIEEMQNHIKEASESIKQNKLNSNKHLEKLNNSDSELEDKKDLSGIDKHESFILSDISNIENLGTKHAKINNNDVDIKISSAITITDSEEIVNIMHDNNERIKEKITKKIQDTVELYEKNGSTIKIKEKNSVQISIKKKLDKSVIKADSKAQKSSIETVNSAKNKKSDKMVASDNLNKKPIKKGEEKTSVNKKPVSKKQSDKPSSTGKE